MLNLEMSILGTRRFPQKAHCLRQSIFGVYTVSCDLSARPHSFFSNVSISAAAVSPPQPYLPNILGRTPEGLQLRVPASLLVVEVLLAPLQGS